MFLISLCKRALPMFHMDSCHENFMKCGLESIQFVPLLSMSDGGGLQGEGL